MQVVVLQKVLEHMLAQFSFFNFGYQVSQRKVIMYWTGQRLYIDLSIAAAVDRLPNNPVPDDKGSHDFILDSKRCGALHE